MDRTNRYIALLLLLGVLFLASGCSGASQPGEQVIDGYALSFAELGTLPMSRIELAYSTESSCLSTKTFDIGIYDQASRLETVTMGNDDEYQKDLEPGDYKVRVENPENYSFIYLPGEEFSLADGIGTVYAMVVNSKYSTRSSQPVAWELYYTEAGSPAGEKPLAGGEIPVLSPGEMYTIQYNPEQNPHRAAGNYMFRLINPGSDSSKKECWSGAVYCLGPIQPTQVQVTLVPNPGKLVVSKKTTGDAPAGVMYEFVISDINNDQREMSRNSIRAGESFTVSLPPGTYQVTESKTGGALSWSKSIEGNISVSSGQSVYLTVTNRFPVPPKGTLNISKQAEGSAPEGAVYEVSISGTSGTIKRNIKAGQTISVELAPGSYEVSESNSQGASQVRKSPEGRITVKSNQTSSVSITNIYPGE
jgi:hypothetical protein